MDSYLKKLIANGENQQLDFKYCISDSRKIARTLSAFANTDGGRILIGVRDNGSIAGIKSDEEYYMVDTAVQLYCRPEIDFTIKRAITARPLVADGRLYVYADDGTLAALIPGGLTAEDRAAGGATGGGAGVVTSPDLPKPGSPTGGAAL